jgi:hypothetical protein
MTGADIYPFARIPGFRPSRRQRDHRLKAQKAMSPSRPKSHRSQADHQLLRDG